jgi:citrate synthase
VPTCPAGIGEHHAGALLTCSADVPCWRAGKAPALAALAYHRATGRQAAAPNQRLDYAENFLYMLDAGPKQNYRPNPRLARAINILFILHAEHEMNCSTAAVRHAGRFVVKP